MEIVGGNWKTWLGIGLMFPWAIGYSVLPWVAYAVPSWWKLQLVISSPLPVFLIIYWFLPECPRWLLTKGRVNEARTILKKAAQINGNTPDDQMDLNAFDASNLATNSKDEYQGKKTNLLDLFKTPNMRKNTLIQYFNWFTVAFVYYGLTLNSDKLIPGNVYINFCVSGLIEFPAYIFCLVVIHFLGRKIPLSLMFLSSFLILLVTIGITSPVAKLAVVSLGKFGIICVFAIIYLHAAELFPTVLRNTGLGSASMFGRVGSMLAPVVGRELHPTATLSIFASMSMLAGILTLWLPETRGLKMIDTIEEAESLECTRKLISRPKTQRAPTV